MLGFFQSAHPDVEFNIIESGQDEMLKGLLAGSMDIALMSRPDHDEVEFVPVLDDPMVAVFPPDHSLSSFDYIPVSELSKYPLIMTYPEYDTDAHRVLKSAGLESDVKYYFKDDFAVLSMVRHGLGISVLPELSIERFEGSYDYRMLDPEAYRTLGIGIRSIKEAGPLARSVISYIRKSIR